MFGLSMTFAQLVHLAVLLEFYYMQQGRLKQLSALYDVYARSALFHACQVFL